MQNVMTKISCQPPRQEHPGYSGARFSKLHSSSSRLFFAAA
jgi:hypothetical protein